MSFFDWVRSTKAEPVDMPKESAERARSFFSTHAFEAGRKLIDAAAVIAELVKAAPKPIAAAGAMDASDGTPSLKRPTMGVPEVLASWYASQTFIGHQMCAILAQHWLIAKACRMPGRDAIRGGFDIVTVDGDELDAETVKALRRADRAMKLTLNLEQFITHGRIFGVRVALFEVESDDRDYYEKPFNIDGVTEGSYKGIVQVDPYWCVPQIDQFSVSSPDNMHFYEPTWWVINGKKYHRTHLIIFRNGEVPDLLKPQYLYGGIPIPQLIMERVYAAERVANEAPQLVQTKRTNVWLTNMDAVMGDSDAAMKRLDDWVSYRDNYGIKLGDKDGDEFQQFDTALADLDTVIMTQYQIVAAAANVPSTKMLGTSPKGFNATGEFEEASYHEELESIQTHDLTPLIERHHALVMRSMVLKVDGEYVDTTVNWKPLDSPTAKELADTNLVKAQTGAALIQSGAISSEDERRRVVEDPSGGYAALGIDAEMPVEELEDGGDGPDDDDDLSDED